jgi:oligopeptide/dipeptide ABC transporter ATP-binding protein
VSTLLDITDLSKLYPLRRGLLAALRGGEAPMLRAVDGVSLRLAAGEIVAIVGESGSGKTTTGKLVTLQEQPTSGTIRFEGRDVLGLRGAELKEYRRRVQMIFQNPYEALDPRYTILRTIVEPLEIHAIGTPAERRETAEAMLAKVDLRPTSRFAERYPADLSGGQLQRVAIARALVLGPKLVIADEPVSMLDVSVRAGVMNLMLSLSAELGLASLYITHDLAVARAMSTRIAVMYLGAVVEEGPTETLVSRSAHPYTRLLVGAVPEHRAGSRRTRVKLAGEATSVSSRPTGCRFAPRCPRVQALCTTSVPAPVTIGEGHWSACHFAAEVGAET